MINLTVTIDGVPYEIDLGPLTGGIGEAIVNGEKLSVNVPQHGAVVTEVEWLIVNGWPYEIIFDPNLQWIRAYDGLHTIEVHDRSQRVARPRSGDGRVKAPIPGLISRVLVEPGATVSAGQPLVVLEAMKMENEIRAPFDGVVSALSVSVGQTVLGNQVLAEVK